MEREIPKHIAIIMDGNGRWATSRNKKRVEGHKAGADTLELIVKHSMEIGVKYLTVYAFSTENWKRPKDEVNSIMTLFINFLNMKKKSLNKRGIKLFITGSKNRIDKKLLSKIDEVENFLSNNDKFVLNIAFNYGGRQEILDATSKLVLDRIEEVNKNEVTEDEFKKYLYRPQIPDPELVIRTSGEFRISNFLLWEIAYSEFYITDTYWPDFDVNEYNKAIESFNKRDRRYGGLKGN